ncbi:hypothetical protein [Vulgatibacter sp.]|uniref:hypothetical protein n=1 Tax=Vulgatibacter sp. TaxID=1971226 RepID=UPI003569BEE7
MSHPRAGGRRRCSAGAACAAFVRAAPVEGAPDEEAGVGRGWRWWLATVGAVGCIGLLAEGAAAWLQPPSPPAPRASDPAPATLLGPALRDRAVLRPGSSLARRDLVAAPDGPSLGMVREPRFGATVQWLRRCTSGDAVVTVERLREGVTWVVVHREGKPCFRLPFADGPDQAPASLRIHGTVDAAGDAGPIGIVHTAALQPLLGDDGLMFRREEVHMLLVGLDGRILLERALETRAAAAGAWGSALSLAPLIWDGETLVAWSSARRWEANATQCLGSLLRLQRRGPAAVAEGVPCEAAGVVDVDGDGLVEIAATTASADGVPWEAIVDAGGDFAATWASAATPPRLIGEVAPSLLVGPADPLAGSRLVPWPWRDEGRELPPDDGVRFTFDWDGDGADEVILSRAGGALVLDAAGVRLAEVEGVPLVGRIDGSVRELLVRRATCVAAVATDGGSRCAPGDVGALERQVSVGRSFDWTADGTADVTAIGTGADGTLLLAAWAEGDLTFAWTASTLEELPPRHQAPRALSLSGKRGAEVLVATPEGFAIRAVPDGAIRWRALAEDGVLDAWALPASGPSSIAVR